MKRIALLIFTLALAVTRLSACTAGEAADILAENAETATGVCPFELDIASTITSFSYDRDENIFSAMVLVNTDEFPLWMFLRDEGDSYAKIVMTRYILGSERRFLLKNIIDAGAMFSFCFYVDSGDSISYGLNLDELKSLYDYHISDSERWAMTLEAMVLILNCDTPQKIDDLLTLSGYEWGDNCVIINYMLEDQDMPTLLCDIHEHSEMIKSDTVSQIEADDLKEILMAAGANLVIRYRSALTGDSCDIVVSPDEF